MSCDWFVKPADPCACCGRSFEPIRIGVSAIGWAFHFYSPPFRDGEPIPPMTMDAWRPFLVGKTILDEYDREHTPAEFEAFVDRKKGLRTP